MAWHPIILGTAIALVDLGLSFVEGLLSAFWGLTEYLGAAGFVLTFVVFFAGGKFGGAKVFWPALVAYTILGAGSAYLGAALLSESVAVYLGRIWLVSLFNLVIVVIALRAGILSHVVSKEVR